MSELLVIIGGATGSGKTQLAINLALHFNTVVISADSRQFFKELNIGTAKPSTEELNQVKHYFINSHSIKENFNAGSYALEVLDLLKELFQTHKVVIMTGGSGLYIDAVINGIDELPFVSDEIRQELNTIYKLKGITELQKMLLEKDPDSYRSIDIMNPKRVTRALEICIASDRPYSSFLGKKTKNFPYNYLIAGLDWPRAELYERIKKRTAEMIKAGLEQEVCALRNYENVNALRTVGYKEMFLLLDGKISLPEAEELISKNTRNYAKRQMTWFRKYKKMIWINPGNEKELVERIEKSLL